MTLLILGVALWWAAHLFKRIAPEARASMGQSGKGAVAAALIIAIVLMVIGYRATDVTMWWAATPMLKGINNLLVLIGFYLFAASGAQSRLGVRMRHPQLIGFSLWAVAHLLVNGDAPSLRAVRRAAAVGAGGNGGHQPGAAELDRARPSDSAAQGMDDRAGRRRVYVIVGLIHAWIGPNPWGA